MRNCQCLPGRQCAAAPCRSAGDEGQNSCSHYLPCYRVNSGTYAAAASVHADHLPCYQVNSGTDEALAPASAGI